MTDQIAAQAIQKIELRNLCPSEWGFSEGKCTVRISCYRIMLPPHDTPHLHTADLLGWRMCLLNSSIRYTPPAEMAITDSNGNMTVVCEKEKETSNDWHFLLMAKSTDNGAVDAIPEESAIGLIRLRLGRNAAFDKVFNTSIRPDGQEGSFSRPMENPGWHGPPMLSAKEISGLASDVEAFQKAPESHRVKDRLLLAARWLTRSYEAPGVDALLSTWIAVEALVGSDQPVKKVNKSLARIYVCSEKQAEDRFLIRPIHKLRCKIVHEGRLAGVHAYVLAYVRAVLADLADDTLGATSRFRAREMLGKVFNEKPVAVTLREALKEFDSSGSSPLRGHLHK